LGHEGVFEPENKQVHLIQLADNSADILCEGLYTHQNEIWDLAACPFDSQFFSTVYASGIIRGVFPFEFVIGQMMTVKTTFFLLSSFESSPCQKKLDQGVLQVLYVKYQCPWLQ
jgi:hypothetical protein